MEGHNDSQKMVSGSAPSRTDDKHSRRPRLLLVDDDPVFRGALVSLGRSLGFDVEAYESMQDLEPFSRLDTYNGAIFDYHLVGMNSIDIVSHLKPFFSKIPTLLVSADDHANHEFLKNLDCGFVGFISKRAGGLGILRQMQGMLHREASPAADLAY
jgi:CheY-like chemotaxis protein